MLNSGAVNSASLNAEPTATLIWYAQDVCSDGTLSGAVAAPFLVILRRSVSFQNEPAVDVCIRRGGGHKTSPRHIKKRNYQIESVKSKVKYKGRKGYTLDIISLVQFS